MNSLEDDTEVWQDQMPTELLEPSVAWQERYLISWVGQQRLAIPSSWVSEIIVVERTRVLSFPFYDPMLIGVAHHEGQIVPLIALWNQSRAPQTQRLRETLSAIRLGSAVGALAGVGLVVDQISGTLSQEQVLAHRQTATSHANAATNAASDAPIQVFQPEVIPPLIWQPQ